VALFSLGGEEKKNDDYPGRGREGEKQNGFAIRAEGMLSTEEDFLRGKKVTGGIEHYGQLDSMV